MRPVLRFVLPLLLILAPFAATAQTRFVDPTPEELKMTSDPKDPGASAVYLNVEEAANDELLFHTYYARVKVLTEKGKEQATVEITYPANFYRIADIKGRTIHPDGTIIPLDMKPADLVVLNAKEMSNDKSEALSSYKVGDVNIKKVAFNLPSVEVGSILEYRWQLDYDIEHKDNFTAYRYMMPPHWQIQQSLFVHKAHYSFITPVRGASYGPNTKLLFYYYLPDGSKMVQDTTSNRPDNQNIRYTLDVADVPKTPVEEYMPPDNMSRYQVNFYYTTSANPAEFWKESGKNWAQKVNGFVSASNPVREAVAQLVAPGDSEEAKARKLYIAVQSLENTDFTRSRSASELKQNDEKAIKRAEDVWTQKRGTGDEIAMLYLSLLRAAGLNASAVSVVNRDRFTYNSGYLSMIQFDDYLVDIKLNSKDLFTDPGQKMCPFGQLHWKHQFAGAILQNGKEAQYFKTSPNSYKDATTSRFADLTIDEQGSLSGRVNYVMSGPAALHWRQLALRNDESEVKKQFVEYLQRYLPDGINAEFDHFIDLDQPEEKLVAVVKVSGTDSTHTGKRLFLPGLFFESHARHPFIATEKRQNAIDMEYAAQQIDKVIYHLPTGYSVESMPTQAPIQWGSNAVLQIKSSYEDGDVTIARVLARGFTVLEAKEYPELRSFYQKVAAADQQQLVLKMPATAGVQ